MWSFGVNLLAICRFPRGVSAPCNFACTQASGQRSRWGGAAQLIVVFQHTLNWLIDPFQGN